MPLVRCPDCRREVSERAESCPHCGSPMRAPKREGLFLRTLNFGCVGCLGLLGLIALFWVIGATTG
jgi:hypothetical protein